MNERQQLLQLLNIAKRKLVTGHLLHYFLWGILVLTGCIALLHGIARFVVILNIPEKIGVLTILTIVLTFVISFYKRPMNRDAAYLFDEFAGDDRVITALHYIKDDSTISQLQRQDALNAMKRHLDQVKKRKIKRGKWWPLLMLSTLFIILSITSHLFPNEIMDMAKQQEKEAEIMEETKEELDELLQREEQDEQLSELIQELEEISELEELLEQLMEVEATINEQKQRSLEEEQALEEIANLLREQDFEGLADALQQSNKEEALQAFQELLENFPSLTEEQQQALEEAIAQLTNGEHTSLSTGDNQGIMESLEESLLSLFENIDSIAEQNKLQEEIQEIASRLNDRSTEAGLTEDRQLAFSDASSSNSSSQEGSQNGEGNPSQDGSADGNTPGEGSTGSEGNSPGEGEGSTGSEGNSPGDGEGGSGVGQGSGNGNGTGTGAGFGRGSRELTIPEYLDGEEVVEEDYGELGEGTSQEQMTGNGPVTRGTVKSYEEVYGNYSESYRTGVERLNLPSYLEDVVKRYYSELNPKGENRGE